MKYLFLFLICALPFVASAQLPVTFAAGWQPSEANKGKFFGEIEVSFRVDVDKKTNIRDADAAFIMGFRYGAETLSDPEGPEIQDYLFVLSRGYFPLNAWKLKGIATLEYDVINDRFKMGPGLFIPLGEHLSINAEAVWGLWNGNNEFSRDYGVMTSLRYRF